MLSHPPAGSADSAQKFVPRVEQLEERQVCSAASLDTLTLFGIVHPPATPPRTGGVATLIGSTLLVVTNKPGANSSVVKDDGAGDVTVEWNGHTPPTFHNVQRIVLDGRGGANTFTYILDGNVSVPHAVDVRLDGNHSRFIKELHGQTNGELTFQIEHGPLPANPALGP